VRFIPLGALCALSVAALLGAGLRVAARTGSVGLERFVAAAVVAGAAAVIEALALGLIGLGSSPVALPLAAGATWFVAQRRLPAPRPRPRAEVAAWWRRLSAPQQLAFGAAAGAGVFLLAWSLFHPYISLDAKDDKGNVQHWVFELAGPNALVQAGLSRENRGGLKPGDMVKIEGLAAKDGSTTGFLNKLYFADGRVFVPASKNP